MTSNPDPQNQSTSVLSILDNALSSISLVLDDNTSNNNSNNNTTADVNTSSIKGDVVLSLKGIPEYDQYPYSMAKEKFYFMASIKAPYFRAENRAPIDLVCVIDESGSMTGDRIRLVRETVVFIVKNLEAQDRFACVGFETKSRTVIGLTRMDKKGREEALVAVDTIKARGSTALCGGLIMGINILRDRQTSNNQAISSVMLFTDGQATDGPKSAIAIIAAMTDPNWTSGGRKHTPSSNKSNVQNRSSMPPSNTVGTAAGFLSGVTNMLGFGNKRSSQPAQTLNVQQQQQIQQKPSPMGSTASSNNNNNSSSGGVPPGQAKEPGEESKDNEKSKLVGETNVEEFHVLPCTINTFGFGTGHNSKMLEAIAEHGRGMYAFIKNADMIADTFAECLGGLVSVIGQNLKIKVEALNDVQINKCLSQGFPIHVPRVGKEIAITIVDIQSEESRDLVFELSMPAINEELKAYPIVQFSVQYQNVITKAPQVLSIVSSISRVSGTDIGERNIELDLQYNRLIAAEAMHKADEMAEKGKLTEARAMLKQAQVTIQQSRTNENQYCLNLVDDITQCSNKLHSQQMYENQGSNMLKSNKKSHYIQRSCQSQAYSSQNYYKNSSKKSMMRKFKK